MRSLLVDFWCQQFKLLVFVASERRAGLQAKRPNMIIFLFFMKGGRKSVCAYVYFLTCSCSPAFGEQC